MRSDASRDSHLSFHSRAAARPSQGRIEITSASIVNRYRGPAEKPGVPVPRLGPLADDYLDRQRSCQIDRHLLMYLDAGAFIFGGILFDRVLRM